MKKHNTMATNNLTARKGKCINFGNCSIADTKEIIEVNLGDDFVCSNPDCRGMLVEEKKQPQKKWILYAGIAIVFIGSILFLYIKSKVEQVTDASKVVEKAISTIEKITDEGSDIKKEVNASTNTLPSKIGRASCREIV